jgi:lipoprotein-releasing system permease protein
VHSVVLFIAFRQLWARKLLNGIAVLGVTLGVVVLIAINGIMQGFQRKFLDNIQRISPHVTLFDKELRPDASLLARYTQEFVTAHVLHATPSDRQLRIRRPSELVRALERMPEVRAAAGLIVGSAVVAYGPQQYPVDLRGIEPDAQDRVTPISKYVVEGQFQTLISGEGVILGAGVASRIGAKVDDYVTVGSPRGESMRLKVVGLFDCDIPPVTNTRIYTKLADAQTILGKPDTIGRIEVQLRDSNQAQRVASELEGRFGYDAESWQETNANFLSLFKQQNTIITFVVGAILAVGGFAILAIQIMIVLQKTRDIAILRSVGFRRADILSGFLLQGAVIAIVGAAIGDLLGHWVVVLLGNLKTRQEGLVKSETFLVYDDPAFYVYGVVFALVVGITASLIPALRGSRVEPVDVLRGQLG